jgi:nucleotide-binding universal stress UspA family protein
MYTVNRLLVPVDFSNVSRAAISAGLRIAAATQAEMWLLTVETGMDRDVRERLNEAPDDTVVEDRIHDSERALSEAIQLELDRCAENGVRLPTIPTQTVVAGGNWVEVILQNIDEHQIDLVVVGTHGREKGVKGMFNSTVSEKLVSRSPCSIMVVKPEGYPYLRD